MSRNLELLLLVILIVIAALVVSVIYSRSNKSDQDKKGKQL